MKMAQSEGIVGIDVSKARLDVHVLTSHEARQIANDPEGCEQLIGWLKSLGVRMAVLEASGGYERLAAKALRRARLVVRVVDPKRVRHYAKAIGRFAKTDPIDAQVIAEFGTILLRQSRHKEIVVEDAAREPLAALVGARQDLVDHKCCLEQQAAATTKGPARRALEAVVTVVARQIDRLERRIVAAIARHPPFAALAKRLDTVPGVGPVSIAAIIAWLPELGLVSRQQIAALVGVAPFDDTSGERVGQRYIQGGRGQLRNVLYMGAMAATQHNPVLKAHYAHLMASGKEHKVAVIACLRKLLAILNTMLARQQDWQPHGAAAPAPAGS